MITNVRSKNTNTVDTFLTLSNIQYLVEGLDSLLQTNLDGEKRSKVISLRDELNSLLNSLFDDFS